MVISGESSSQSSWFGNFFSITTFQCTCFLRKVVRGRWTRKQIWTIFVVTERGTKFSWLFSQYSGKQRLEDSEPTLYTLHVLHGTVKLKKYQYLMAVCPHCAPMCGWGERLPGPTSRLEVQVWQTRRANSKLYSHIIEPKLGHGLTVK